MEIVTKCQICHNRIAEFTCKNCGRHICENCLDKDKNVCVICGKGLHN